MGCFNDTEAKELWHARWHGVHIKFLVAKYQQDPRRLYEVWTEEKNIGTRQLAYDELVISNPSLAANINAEKHVPKRKVVMLPPANSNDNPQLDFFANN